MSKPKEVTITRRLLYVSALAWMCQVFGNMFTGFGYDELSLIAKAISLPPTLMMLYFVFVDPTTFADVHSEEEGI